MNLGSAKAGSLIPTLNGFLSTSIDRNTAAVFANVGRNGVLLEISASKGQQAIDMKSLSVAPTDEKEVLFARGMTLKVVAFNSRKGFMKAELEPMPKPKNLNVADAPSKVTNEVVDGQAEPYNRFVMQEWEYHGMDHSEAEGEPFDLSGWYEEEDGDDA